MSHIVGSGKLYDRNGDRESKSEKLLCLHDKTKKALSKS